MWSATSALCIRPRQGISSNLNLITDKGNIYSSLCRTSPHPMRPDLKVLIEPADHLRHCRGSAALRSLFPPPNSNSRSSSSPRCSRTLAGGRRVQERLSNAAQVRLHFKANEAPFDIQSIYHDDKFTYIKTNAPEKFSVYEMKDGKPNLITYDLREGTYIIPKVMDSGYVELGKKRMDFTRKG
jgi:hypothetical protein